MRDIDKMRVTHTHVMRGTLLVILDYDNTYEVQRSPYGICVSPDPGAIKPNYEMSQRLMSLFLHSEAARY